MTGTLYFLLLKSDMLPTFVTRETAAYNFIQFSGLLARFVLGYFLFWQLLHLGTVQVLSCLFAKSTWSSFI